MKNHGKSGEVYIIGNKNISLYNLFKEIASIHPVKLPKIKLPFIIAYLSAFFIEANARFTHKSPMTTMNKVVSLYNNHSFCNSEKAIKEFEINNISLSKTILKTTNWFCKKYNISL